MSLPEAPEGGAVRVSVVVATLERPTWPDCLAALREQSLPREEYEILKATGGVNEYEARNAAARDARGEVIAFTDDDCVPPPDWLEKGLAHFEKDPRLMVLTGPVVGDVWGHGGWYRVSKPGWFIGANIFTRRSAFLDVGGFEVTWGLDPPPKGWRGDTDLGWRMQDRFGEGSAAHAEDVKMVHPRSMQSQWQPAVEAAFYLRHRARCLTLIAPYDPRLCQFVLQQGLEKDPLVREYLASDQKVRADFARANAEGRTLDLGSSDGWTFHGTTIEHVNFDLDRYQAGEFVQGEATRLPFADGSFDTVYAGEVLEHVEDPEALVREALRVTRGLLLITTPAEREWDPSKAPMLTREERMARDGFSDVDAMQRGFTGRKIGVREVVPESRFPHTWHVNWPTQASLHALLARLGVRHEVRKVRDNGFVWLAARAWKKR
jgi:SAM-dependent methyltransferase